MHALIDCNNFYISCERVFNPLLEKRPAVVLSNNDGCVISRSEEAKKLDIPMGAPAFKYHRIFKQKKIHFFSTNFSLYGDMSQRVMNTLKQFTPEIDIYSIDEAFLDLRGIYEKDMPAYGNKIQNTIKRNTGIPVSIGIAPSKTLAKVAARIAKKFSELQNVYVLDTEEKILKALKWLPLDKVWGIGFRLSKKFYAIGIKTAYEFTQLPENSVRKIAGVTGLRTQKELKGESCIKIDNITSSKKSIAITRTFKKSHTELSALEEAVSYYAGICAVKLRKQASAANFIYTFLQTDMHRKKQPQYRKSVFCRMSITTNDTLEISHYALEMLHKIYQKGFLFKRAGVMVTGIEPQKHFQLDLFDQTNRRKRQQLMSTIDYINQNKGKDKLKLAIQGKGDKYRLGQNRLSSKYTTEWNDILKIGK